MANLIGLKDRFQVAFGNDADVDRHGIVTPSAGLMNPNHYLAVAIAYLLRPPAAAGAADAAVGKTLVSSGIDRQGRGAPSAGARRGARRASSGSSAGSSTARSASAARRAPAPASCAWTARAWTTDKDGILLDLLAAEITAVTGKDPGQHFAELAARFGTPYYTRIDAPATSRAEGGAREAVAGRGEGDDARRRADRRALHRGPGQRRARSEASRS